MQTAYQQRLNRGRFETWTSRPDMELLEVNQIHGVDIVSKGNLPCEADGLIVNWDEFEDTLAIKTADCMPVLIEGEKGVIFLHAGWRGLVNGILRRPEIKRISPFMVLIGPCIHSCCFEVSEDFRANFPEGQFFYQSENKLHFDLANEAKKQLAESFPELPIEIAPECTCCNQKFNSYRRNKTKERNWNLYIKG